MSKKGDDTRQSIRESAQTLFAEKGFKEVTMTDICEATGLSRGGLYRHYESTQQIFLEIMNAGMNLPDDYLYIKMEQGISALSLLEEMLEIYKNEMIDNKNSLSIAIYEFFSNPHNCSDDNTILKHYQRSITIWNSLIQYGIKRGEFNNVNSVAVGDTLLFAYQGVRLFSKLMPIDEEIPERIIQQIRSLLLP